MKRISAGLLLAALLLAAIASGCAPAEHELPKAPVPSAKTAPEAAPTPSRPPAGEAVPHAAEADEPGAIAGCGELGCRLFDSAEQALEAVLAHRPLVLGIGEAHALKGTEPIESTTSRFTRELLPRLAPHSSDLVIELMEPDRRCLQTTEQVKREQAPVTDAQAESNQNEFVLLGTRAKEAGVTPHVLYPSCAEYERIVKAGDDSIFVMLETIAALTDQKVRAILTRNQKQARERLVLLYGGAVHNDSVPRPGRETWSYGPSLAAFTGQRYVELDLIVREYIKDTEVWRSLSWYQHFDKQKHPHRAVLFQPSPASYVLIFPAESASGPVLRPAPSD